MRKHYQVVYHNKKGERKSFWTWNKNKAFAAAAKDVNNDGRVYEDVVGKWRELNAVYKVWTDTDGNVHIEEVEE